MNKLNLNKETISQMDKNQMATINGGGSIVGSICLKSCANGSRKGKPCCMDDIISIQLNK